MLMNILIDVPPLVMNAQIEAAAAEAVQCVGRQKCRATVAVVVVLSAPLTLRHNMVQLIGASIYHPILAPAPKFPGRRPLAQTPFGRSCTCRRNAAAGHGVIELPSDTLFGGTERVGQTPADVVVVLGHVGGSRG